jgi:selenocysteine lyase/cysteine desulfurase
MPTRREFIGSISISAGAAAALAAAPAALARFTPSMLEELAGVPGSPEDLAGNEDFWAMVQQAFTADRSLINFNNGGVSPSPRIVQEAHKRHLDFSNTATAWALWKIQEPQREPVRNRVAQQWGVDPEEIAFTRNSSESLQICQQGMDLKKGDEVLTTTQDYPRMITTFKQRARREEISLKQFKIPIPCEDPSTIVHLFEQNITPKTRAILMSHIINITGQILPVKDVVAMARARNIPVIVDGAHALAHFDYKISDLNCDYYGVSLHKWLHAPVGTGLLYVRRNKIKDLWPLMAAEEKQDTDIRKFEEIGTHPAGPYLAIGDALTFHQAIGGPRKEARLRFLRDRWAKRLLESGKGKVKLHTSLKPQFSCGIGTVQIEGIDTTKIADYLWDKHRILVVAIKHDEFEGLRVTPSVYSTLEEVDRFCDIMENVIKNGLPA